MILRLFFSIFFISALNAKSLHIEGIPKNNISVNINGEYIVRENVISVDKFYLPLKVSVYFVSEDRKNIFLSQQKSFTETKDINLINNRETIINIIEEEIKRNITLEENSYFNLRNVVLDVFKEEIDKFSSIKSFDLLKKLDNVKSDSFNNKFKMAIDKLSNKYYSNSIINLDNITNLKDYYIITKELLFFNNAPFLNTISIHGNLKKRNEMKTVYNKNTLFLVFNKRNDTLSFINYLDPHRDTVSKEFENFDLVSLVFDELLLQCTELFNHQRECFYFDKVENIVANKNDLLNRVYKALPYDFDNQNSFKKLSTIRKVFIETISKIVLNPEEVNSGNSLIY